MSHQRRRVVGQPKKGRTKYSWQLALRPLTTTRVSARWDCSIIYLYFGSNSQLEKRIPDKEGMETWGGKQTKRGGNNKSGVVLKRDGMNSAINRNNFDKRVRQRETKGHLNHSLMSWALHEAKSREDQLFYYLGLRTWWDTIDTDWKQLYVKFNEKLHWYNKIFI